MNKKATIYIISHSGARIRQFSLPRFLLPVSILLFLGSLVALGVGFIEYRHLQYSLSEARGALPRLSAHQQEIETQRQQIQTFAAKINQLKSALVGLNEFENKIRIITNLESKKTETGIFGIGGSIPDDLDPEIPLNKDHASLLKEMHSQAGQILEATESQHDSFESLLQSLHNKKNLLSATPSIRPTEGWETSGFGYRTSPFTGRKEFHSGLDIATKTGTPILAPADGIVTYSGNKWLLGNMIAIDHGHNMITRYGHIDKLLKKTGDKVKRGEVIARVGNTGRSTGPHLHYEVRIAGIPVNPKTYILN